MYFTLVTLIQVCFGLILEHFIFGLRAILLFTFVHLKYIIYVKHNFDENKTNNNFNINDMYLKLQFSIICKLENKLIIDANN